jgi:hypothetical protein
MVETVTAALVVVRGRHGLLAVAIWRRTTSATSPQDEAAGSERSPCVSASSMLELSYGTMVVGAFGTIVAGVLAYLLNDSRRPDAVGVGRARGVAARDPAAGSGSDREPAPT